MRRAARGDSGAFLRLYQSCAPSIRRLFRWQDGDHASLDDLVQEVFVRAWEQRRSFRGDAKARTYLEAIARNVLRESWRKRQRLPLTGLGGLVELPAAPSSALSDPEMAMQSREIARSLRRAKARLSALQRQAWELAHIWQLPSAEAANLAGCTVSQFRERLYRARKKLRWLLRHLREHVTF